MADYRLGYRLVRFFFPVVWLYLAIRARLPGGRYHRFVLLPAWCKRAIERGQLLQAASLARELLSLATLYPDDWNNGNAVHHGHMMLGRVALADGDIGTAREQLIAAGHTSGSPQLNSFGPNMRLAQELLRAGERDVVLEYLGLCRRFWEMGHAELAAWTRDIDENRLPDFGPNLKY